MNDFYEYSTPELVNLFGTRFKKYRLMVGMTQKDVAEQSGVTIATIHKFENGMINNMTFGTFILLIKAIGRINDLDNLMPEQPESPYMYRSENKKVKRIRHKNHE